MTEQREMQGRTESGCAVQDKVKRLALRANIHETAEAFVIEADMAGVPQGALELTLDGELLTLRGRMEEVDREGYQPVSRQFERGEYQRSFRLSGDMDTEKITAELDGGILRVRLPKARERVRRIQIQG